MAGIDLGAAFCRAAWLDDGALRGLDGALQVSAVTESAVGEAALARCADSPEQVRFAPTRTHHPLRAPDAGPSFEAAVRALVGAAAVPEAHRQAVVCASLHPSSRRRALRDAMVAAGLDVARVIGQGAATALGHHFAAPRATGRTAVLRVGAGSFDLTVLRAVDGFVEVLASAGDDEFGADDLDALAAAEMLHEARVSDDSVSAALRWRAARAVREARERLSDRFDVELRLPLPGGESHVRTLSRDQLAALVRPALERISETALTALTESGLHADQFDAVLLSGGLARSPMLRAVAAEVFAGRSARIHAPLRGAVEGAARYAARLRAGSPPSPEAPLLLEASAHALGLVSADGSVDALIPRGSPLPASANRVFTPLEAGARTLELALVEGESGRASGCRSVGAAHVELPGDWPTDASVDVRLWIDADGCLEATAHALEGGAELAARVIPDPGAPPPSAKVFGERLR